MIYAVIDTNVLVSALKTRHHDSATARVLSAIFEGKVTPLYNEAIIAEYQEVLARPRLKLDLEKCEFIVSYIVDFGLDIIAAKSNIEMIDEDDRVFYGVALGARELDAKLVTGNSKHFPLVDFVLSPTEFCRLLDSE